MALVLNEKYERGVGGYALFLTNRFLRLFPAYATVLLLTLTLALVAPPAFVEKWQMSRPIDPGALAFLLGSQLLMIGQDLYSFLGLHHGALVLSADFHVDSNPLYGLMPIPQAWTLGVEIAFYAVAPFIVRRPLAVIVAAIFASVALRLGLQAAFGFEGDPWSYRFFPSEVAVFLIGAVGYRLYRRSEPTALRWLLLVAISVGIALLINRWHGASRVASVIALTTIFVAIPYLARWSQRIKVDRFLGELSYPIYIGHMLVIWTIDGAVHVPAEIHGLVIIVLTVTLSIFIYCVIERPIDRWRQSRLARPDWKPLQTDAVRAPAGCSSR
jgi:peptidoglycan/LPS O-acetylase OafA/YrhL